MTPARAALLAAALFALAACASRPAPPGEGWAGGTGDGTAAPSAGAGPVIERGLASWYGERHHGRRTASGEPFDMHSLTAAHKTLPFGTRVRVEHPATGRSVVVRINDRGPFTPGRVIDLSRAAADRIGLIRAGVAPVVIYAE